MLKVPVVGTRNPFFFTPSSVIIARFELVPRTLYLAILLL